MRVSGPYQVISFLLLTLTLTLTTTTARGSGVPLVLLCLYRSGILWKMRREGTRLVRLTKQGFALVLHVTCSPSFLACLDLGLELGSIRFPRSARIVSDSRDTPLLLRPLEAQLCKLDLFGESLHCLES